MLRLKAMSLNNQQLTDVFNDIDNKIQSMALVHKKLYESKDLSHLNLKDYLEELILQLEQSYSSSSLTLDISVKCVNIQILFDTAMPIGLVVNELVTNSVKHAFPDKQVGHIDIEIKIKKEHEISIKFWVYFRIFTGFNNRFSHFYINVTLFIFLIVVKIKTIGRKGTLSTFLSHFISHFWNNIKIGII